MSFLVVEIGFFAEVGQCLIPDFVVPSGGRLPSVRVQLVRPDDKLHCFFIEKRVPHHHPKVIDAVRAEAERQVELFWNVLSYLLDSPVRPTGEVQYIHDGTVHQLAKPIARANRGNSQSEIGAAWFRNQSGNLALDYNIDLLKRFNFARFLEDPVSRYLSLYALMASVVGDRQKDIDDALIAVDPTIESSVATGRTNHETTFTRLRNELAHHRQDASLIETHREISIQVDRFAWLVSEVLAKHLTSPP